MNLDTVITILAAIGAATCLWWCARILGRLLGWIERSEIARQKAEATAEQSGHAIASSGANTPGPALAPHDGSIPAAHLAAIAAAVGAIGGAHHIVHVGVARTASAWAVEGRWMQQTSHRPH
jgi:hypothetical protein